LGRAPTPDFHDHDDEFLILDFIDDLICSLPHPEPLLAGQFLLPLCLGSSSAALRLFLLSWEEPMSDLQPERIIVA
jgi:hypothetical protein